MCRLRNIAMRDYQESATTGQRCPYVPLCFAGTTKSVPFFFYQILKYIHLCASLFVLYTTTLMCPFVYTAVAVIWTLAVLSKFVRPVGHFL